KRMSRYAVLPRAARALSRRAVLAVLPAILAALLLAPGSLRAAESTSVAGTVAGFEVCPQIWCGAAIFVGRFDGDVDGTTGEGRWWFAVTHEALPLEAGGTTPITGGEWGLLLGDRPLRGGISSGTILNNGDGTFTVRPRLDVVTGGEGRLSLAILLDHRTFPPLVGGSVAAGEIELPAPAPLAVATSAS
ncbi:MAG: hypothetical protein O2822_07990, partial [Chloroflexi bacterium]|nr:hypothetical protein [Chloroflexota bacterium]